MTTETTTKEKTHPRSLEGARALCKLSMLSYWKLGQDAFFDADVDAKALDFATPLGFEPLIGDGATLRRETMEVLGGGGVQRRAWFDVDSTSTTTTTTRAGVFRVRSSDKDWLVVVFRGTTPSPLRGLIRESQINGRAGQTTWRDAPSSMMGGGRVHAGYAEAYAALKSKVEDAVKREMDESASEETRLVVTGHSLGGAMTTLCAARLAEEYGRVDAVTFGQPRVGDSNFVKMIDEGLEGKLSYARVVHAGDLFARVPTSGIWLPTSNEGQFSVEYAHGGSMLWTEAGGESIHSYHPKGSGDPEGFSTDARMINPIGVARAHSGYARFMEDETLRSRWPASGLI